MAKALPIPMDLERATTILDVVRSPDRLRIMFIASNGPVRVAEICEALDMKRPNAAQHLRHLKICRVMESCRDGKEAVYKLTPIGREVVLAANNIAKS